MRKPLVSVIVPTFNSEEFLDMCLGSIRAQIYPNIELIVVDNYSKDKTKEIGEKYADLFLLKGSERSAQINFGALHARGKYVYRVDSDFVLEPCVIEEAVAKCEEQGYDAIAVHNTSDSTISFWSKVRKLERDCYAEDELNIAVRFFRKDVFEKVGGFNEKLVAAEDYEFHNRFLRHGFAFSRIKSKEVHVGEPESLLEVAEKHYYYGRTLRQFLKSNSMRGMRQIYPVRPAFVKNGGNFVRHPILTAGFIVYQIARYISAGLGFLVGEISR